jgi:hypothetical protein
LRARIAAHGRCAIGADDADRATGGVKDIIACEASYNASAGVEASGSGARIDDATALPHGVATFGHSACAGATGVLHPLGVGVRARASTTPWATLRDARVQRRAYFRVPRVLGDIGDATRRRVNG